MISHVLKSIFPECLHWEKGPKVIRTADCFQLICKFFLSQIIIIITTHQIKRPWNFVSYFKLIKRRHCSGDFSKEKDLGSLCLFSCGRLRLVRARRRVDEFQDRSR